MDARTLPAVRVDKFGDHVGIVLVCQDAIAAGGTQDRLCIGLAPTYAEAISHAQNFALALRVAIDSLARRRGSL